MFAFLAAALLPTASMQAAVKEAVGRTLADPYSAQYDWQPVKNETLYCGWVNAKNGFGAYAGYQPFMVLYATNAKSGKTTVFSTDTSPTVVTPMCLDHGYVLTR